MVKRLNFMNMSIILHNFDYFLRYKPSKTGYQVSPGLHFGPKITLCTLSSFPNNELLPMAFEIIRRVGSLKPASAEANRIVLKCLWCFMVKISDFVSCSQVCGLSKA